MLLLPETVDAPALAQEIAELRAARFASVHHHAPACLVGPPGEGAPGGAEGSTALDDPASLCGVPGGSGVFSIEES